MDNSVLTLIGTIAVAVTSSLITTALTHHFTRTREESKLVREQGLEHERWLRDQRQSCYHNAVKYLIRVKAVGSVINNITEFTLPQDAPQNWYDDLAEANTWLSSLHYFCGDEYHDEIGEASVDFFNLSNWLIGSRPTGKISSTQFSHIVSKNGRLDYQALVDFINQTENTISNCARREFKLGPRKSFIFE